MAVPGSLWRHCKISVLVMREPAAMHQALAYQRFSHGLLSTFLRLVPVLIAAFGASAAQAGPSPALACSPAFDSSQNLWAAADFDGDKTIDLARVNVRRAGNRVVASGVELFAFCENSVPSIFSSFPLAELVLSARDIDADHDQDLILRDPFGGKALGVWLNDGTGAFSETKPSAFPGAGDDPPTLGKRVSRFHQPAASSSSKTCASVTRSASRSRFAPSSPRGPIENPTCFTSGWQDSRQSRGPPLSC